MQILSVFYRMKGSNFGRTLQVSKYKVFFFFFIEITIEINNVVFAGQPLEGYVTDVKRSWVRDVTSKLN